MCAIVCFECRPTAEGVCKGRGACRVGGWRCPEVILGRGQGGVPVEGTRFLPRKRSESRRWNRTQCGLFSGHLASRPSPEKGRRALLGLSPSYLRRHAVFETEGLGVGFFDERKRIL